jgi:hypothetical protein
MTTVASENGGAGRVVEIHDPRVQVEEALCSLS